MARGDWKKIIAEMETIAATSFFLIEYKNHKNRRLYNENLARSGPSSIDVSQRIPSVDEGEN